MDSYPLDKKALREAWIVGWLIIRWITSILTGKNRIFLKFPTSTSTVARYLWKLSLLHPCITCEFHQITNHRLAVNDFCVHMMFCRPNSLQCFVFPHVVMSFLSTYRYIGLFAKAIAKTQDCEFCFFLLHLYLWIFVFLDLELNSKQF